MTGMSKWTCPKCSKQIQVIAGTSQVSHRCPGNKNLMTEFKKDKE